MKNIFALLLLVSFFSCKKENTAATQTVKEEVKKEEILPVIIFEKTPCFGTCPIYKVEIFKDGSMSYSGKRFVSLIGDYQLNMPLEIVSEFRRRARDINFFKLEDKYDGNVTDLPSTITTITDDGITKTIIARYQIPDELRDYNVDLHNKIMSIVNPNANSIQEREKKREELKRTPIKKEEIIKK